MLNKCRNDVPKYVMIAEKLIVLWPVLLGGGRKSAPPAAFILFYRLQLIWLMSELDVNV